LPALGEGWPGSPVVARRQGSMVEMAEEARSLSLRSPRENAHFTAV
jgi:hypothetical protein